MAVIRPQVGVGVLVFNAGRILLGKRKGAHGAGNWAAPGGHLDFGESVEECARRELLEETGLTALSVKTGLWSNDIIDGTKHYITLFATVDRFEGEVQLLEPDRCEEWRWFAKEALPSPLFPPLRSFFEDKCPAPHKHVVEALLEFYEARDWYQFHSPKNIVMDVAAEAGELVDIFRWLTEEQSYHLDPAAMQEARDEIADVLKAVLYLSHKLGIDPIESALQKIEKMKRKYPVDQCRGRSLKYTAYE